VVMNLVSATSGAIDLYAGGGGLTVGGDGVGRDGVATTGGSITLVAERGDLLLDAGVQVAGAGDIALRANDGAIRTTVGAAQWRTEGSGFDPDLDWALVNRRFDIDLSTGQITAARLNEADIQIHGLMNGQVLRDAGGAYVQTTDGKLTMTASGAIGEIPLGTSPLYSPLAIFVDAEELVASSSGRENVLVIAADEVDVGDAGALAGASGSRAGVTRVFSLQGAQTVHSAVDAGGEDISLIADDLDIGAPIRSAGGNLNIRPNDPTVALVIGDLVDDTQAAGVDVGPADWGYLQLTGTL